MSLIAHESHIACLALFVMGNLLYIIQDMLHRSLGLKCDNFGVWLAPWNVIHTSVIHITQYRGASLRLNNVGMV